MTDKRSTKHAAELTPDEKEFARRAGRQLKDSADTLDAATLSHLNQARQRALDELPNGGRTTSRWWLPAGAVAVTAAVAISLWQTIAPVSDSEPAIPVAAGDITDVELLLDDSDLAMIEDLEFFAWLATDEPMSPETT
jgi:hypothetical protein